uniref:Uncharacterized protein n=2 Tax=Physcomitrium patens TaxID=3218 RepID=A0A2K1KEK8_PHYPA|nr:hypothetical protein PHYPA_008584 [Physcomitrium patens]
MLHDDRCSVLSHSIHPQQTQLARITKTRSRSAASSSKSGSVGQEILKCEKSSSDAIEPCTETPQQVSAGWVQSQPFLGGLGRREMEKQFGSVQGIPVKAMEKPRRECLAPPHNTAQRCNAIFVTPQTLCSVNRVVAAAALVATSKTRTRFPMCVVCSGKP